MAYINGKEILFSPSVTVVDSALQERLIARTITDADLETLLAKMEKKSIPRGAFARCEKITSVVFPDNLGESLEAYAFDNATNLKIVDFGKWKPKRMGGTCFQSTAIEEIDIPDTITSAAFNSMTKLKKIRFYGNALTSLGTAFYGCSAIELIDFSNFTGNALPTVEKATQAAPNSTCKILVKPEIIRTAKLQTNWSAKASQIVCSLEEGYTVTSNIALTCYINGAEKTFTAGETVTGVHCIGAGDTNFVYQMGGTTGSTKNGVDFSITNNATITALA